MPDFSFFGVLQNPHTVSIFECASNFIVAYNSISGVSMPFPCNSILGVFDH